MRRQYFCRPELDIITTEKIQIHPLFPTRTTQVEDSRPLNIGSTTSKHNAVLRYAAIDLNIYTFFVVSTLSLLKLIFNPVF